MELGFTIAMTLFVVAALATLRPERVDACSCGVFVVQLIYPTPFVRIAATFVLLVFAIDLLFARRRHVRPLLRAVGRRTSDRGGSRGVGSCATPHGIRHPNWWRRQASPRRRRFTRVSVRLHRTLAASRRWCP